jgi:ATP-dependent Zn protease
MPEDNIDKALLRAGRVDQIIHISYPTFEERIDLFKMYLDKLLSDSIDLNLIGKLTYGLTGSDIKKIVNSIKINKVYEKTLVVKSEQDNLTSTSSISNTSNIEKTGLLKYLSKIIIFKKTKQNDSNKDLIDPNKFELEIKPTTVDIDKEINKCILGLERERKINLINKKLISFHETGHAIMSFILDGTKLPTKICISITSKTLGYTMYTQDDEDLIMGTSINNLLRQVMILYSGRCAEKIFMGEVTCGAEDDYMKARKILKRLVMNGMIYPEFNFVESTSHESSKVPEHIEKILSKINKYLIEQVDKILKDNSDIINITAEKIQELGSINGDDIKNIFESNGKTDIIQSFDINSIYNQIVNFNK